MTFENGLVRKLSVCATQGISSKETASPTLAGVIRADMQKMAANVFRVVAKFLVFNSVIKEDPLYLGKMIRRFVIKEDPRWPGHDVETAPDNAVKDMMIEEVRDESRYISGIYTSPGSLRRYIEDYAPFFEIIRWDIQNDGLPLIYYVENKVRQQASVLAPLRICEELTCCRVSLIGTTTRPVVSRRESIISRPVGCTPTNHWQLLYDQCHRTQM